MYVRVSVVELIPLFFLFVFCVCFLFFWGYG